jgi:hypothetical protein
MHDSTTAHAASQRGPSVVPGQHVAVTVLSASGGTPDKVELDGDVWIRAGEWTEGQRDERWLLERDRLHQRLREAAGEAAADLAWEWYGLMMGYAQDGRVRVIKELGHLLRRERLPDLWRRLYLTLRANAHFEHLIYEAVGHQAYQEHDELRFLYGEHWQRHVPKQDESPEPTVAIPVEGTIADIGRRAPRP